VPPPPATDTQGIVTMTMKSRYLYLPKPKPTDVQHHRTSSVSSLQLLMVSTVSHQSQTKHYTRIQLLSHMNRTSRWNRVSHRVLGISTVQSRNFWESGELSIATGYGLNCSGSTLGKGQSSDRLRGPPSLLSNRLKRLRSDSGHSPPSRAEVKVIWVIPPLRRTSSW
jgi:hypothetical protein